MSLEFRPLGWAIAAEVIGVDLARPIDAASFEAIHAAWLRYNVLVFRDVDITPEQQIAFSRRFGELQVLAGNEYNLPGHPEILVISNVKEDGKHVGLRGVGRGWHTDGENRLITNAGSFLYALKVPPHGGDTLFANMHAAYDAMPAALKTRITGRRARYSQVRLHAVHHSHLPPLTPEQIAERPDVYHPLVCTHPEAGREALYIGRWACAVEGMPEQEGRELIAELQAFTTQPQFTYRHQWRVHDAVLWDNRWTQHCATEFDESQYERHMHRTTPGGDKRYFDDGTGVIFSAYASDN